MWDIMWPMNWAIPVTFECHFRYYERFYCMSQQYIIYNVHNNGRTSFVSNHIYCCIPTEGLFDHAERD